MAANEIAVGKRIRISKMQQHIILIVLVTSLVFGVALVLSIYFIKYIVFNTKVITAKDEAIVQYEKTISNVGICIDTNGDGKFSADELNNCNPESIAVEDIPGTLRYNVLINMAQNEDLESVGRDSLDSCYGEDGRKLNYNNLYQRARTDSDRMYAIYLNKMCSALRVIPDALPAFQNEEALMASLNQIFIISDGFQPEALSPSGNISRSSIQGLGTMPVSLVVEGTSDQTMLVLDNIEKSIRAFDIRSATISWSGVGQLELRAQASAYYTSEVKASEQSQTVYATDKAKEKARGSR